MPQHRPFVHQNEMGRRTCPDTCRGTIERKRRTKDGRLLRMQVPSSIFADLGRLAESFQRNPLGALFVILLILSLVLGVYCWRWAPRAPTRAKGNGARPIGKVFDLLFKRP